MIGLVRALSGVAGMAKRRVFVVGVGMTKFEKPGRREDFDYPDMALESGTKALEDAGISYDKVQQACVGYVYGDSTCGQRAVYGLGMTGIPVYNVNNNCSTGSTALFMAKQFVEGGISDCVLALGFEKMQRGSLSSQYDDRTNPLDKHVMTMTNICGIEAAPMAPQMFGNAGRQYMKENNVKPETVGKIAVKNHKHSVNNPYSQFQDEYTLDEIMASQEIFAPLTKLQCCPTSDGSAAVIVASEEFVQKNNLEGQAVEILAQEMTTDFTDSFDVSPMKMVGFDMTKAAADKVYRVSGLTPNDVDVVELHDCFSANELITYDALGLCEPGKAGELVESGNNTYGGKYVINPSGGLISKGHPLGATGLAQCSELCWQLRGLAGKRQVAGAKVGLQHNIGLGGAAVVSMYRLGFPDKVQARAYSSQAGGDSGSDASGSSQLGDPKYMCTPLFTEIQSRLVKDGADFVKKVNGVFCFKLKNEPDGTHWVIDAKNGTGAVTFGADDKADCTMTASDKDFFNLFSGKLNPQQAFFTGKLRISGDMALAMKLKEFQMKGGPAKL